MTSSGPTKDELADNEILVEVDNDAKPDSLNRVHFTAFWLDLPPAGVRARSISTATWTGISSSGSAVVTRCAVAGRQCRR